MAQLLPLVVRSNARPNSWVVFVAGSAGGCFRWLLVTRCHGDVVVGGLSLVGLICPLIFRVPTASAIVSLIGAVGFGWRVDPVAA